MDLTINIGKTRLKNPLILASAPYTKNQKGFEKYISKGFGAVVSKSTTVKPLEGAPKPTMFWFDPDRKSMLAGAEALKNPGLEKMAKTISAVKKLAESEGCLIVGSIAGNTVEEMIQVAKGFEEAGADVIEINMVCNSTGSYLGPEYENLGRYWSLAPERVVEAVRGMKSAVSLPVWPKVSIQSLIKEGFLQKVDKEAAPDAYSFIGGRMPNLTIDIETGKPKLTGHLKLKMEKGIPIDFGSHGPIKSSTILHTAYLAKLTDTPLVCAGGLSKGEDVVEALMAGSSASQICTAVYRNSNAAGKFLKDIGSFMERRGIESLNDIRGIALQHIPAPPLLKIPRVSVS